MPRHALRAVEPDLCAPAAEIARHLVALCSPEKGAIDLVQPSPALAAQFLQERPTGAQE
jgi:hypothetical protein